MPDNELARQIKQIPLFAKLGRDDLKAVARLVNRAEYPARGEICRQGTLGQTAYYVESGELRVLHVDAEGIEQETGRLGPGDYFGETSLLLGEPRDATVEVVRDATLLYLNKGDFDQLRDQRPWLVEGLEMRPDVADKVRAPRFAWQDPGEVVVSNLHKHNAILARNIALPSLVLLLNLLLFGFWFVRSGSALALAVAAILGFFPGLLIVYLTVDHLNDNYIVTNKRVVHEERVPLVMESRTEAPLRSVQDIQQVREGFLAQIYNFGDLIIETAGERGHVIFRQIPKPAEIRDIIFEQADRVVSWARAEERAGIREALHHHFGIPSLEESASGSGAASQPSDAGLSVAQWIRQPLRMLRYFMPPLWYEEGDTVTWRKHWLPLIKPILPPTLIMFSATLLTVYLAARHFRGEGRTPLLIGYGVVMAVAFVWWLWTFDDWQNDVYQVTATRIIDVERQPLYLQEKRREASLGVIQNVSSEIPGVLGNLLNYGSVTIETAGAGAFTFDNVKDPRGVQAEIFRRVEAFQAKKRSEETDRRRTELLDWFSVYDQVRRSTPPSNIP